MLPTSAMSTLNSDQYFEGQSEGRKGTGKKGVGTRDLTIDVDHGSPTRMPITPRSSSFARSAARQDVLRQALEEEADAEHCLLAMSVRNVFGVPFEVCLARVPGESGRDVDPNVGEVVATRLIPPGATERYVLHPRLLSNVRI